MRNIVWLLIIVAVGYLGYKGCAAFERGAAVRKVDSQINKLTGEALSAYRELDWSTSIEKYNELLKLIRTSLKQESIGELIDRGAQEYNILAEQNHIPLQYHGLDEKDGLGAQLFEHLKPTYDLVNDKLQEVKLINQIGIDYKGKLQTKASIESSLGSNVSWIRDEIFIKIQSLINWNSDDYFNRIRDIQTKLESMDDFKPSDEVINYLNNLQMEIGKLKNWALEVRRQEFKQ
jgi:hypothetical protein